MDVLDSLVPGLAGQIRGNLTKKRYTGAAVFVDNFSGLSYVHLLLGKTADDLIAACQSYLLFCKKHAVVCEHFHADNGIFEARKFRESIEATGHSITYCGVNAHHQNGHAEKRIRDLQDQARSIMLHAQRCWPSAVSTHLWPYAL